jgi:soluble lytic murein transglycosylase-like protein
MTCARAAIGACLLLIAATASVAGPATPEGRELAAVRRLLSAQARQRLSEGERAAAMADVSMLADAIGGRHDRDTAAYSLLALGYSPRETADVVSGRISRRSLDAARQMLGAGQPAELVANYLDRQYRPLVSRTLPSVPFRQAPRALAGAYDTLIDTYSRLCNVSASLIRAMIATESGFRPDARSPAGAIGLMQLMPATARELGVNPRLPEQNIEGGVRYFSELLRMFGTTELALIAYNGGPGFARRYARREIALYGETRDYVRKVLTAQCSMPNAQCPRPDYSTSTRSRPSRLAR